MVHVEGVGGWADRLKHVLRSGAALARQDQGVVEWFEPLLQPWVHYVPVSSTLGNLSQAIQWLRSNDDEARAMAMEAALFVRSTMRPSALAYYMAEVLQGYARMYRNSSGVPALLERVQHDGIAVSVECEESSADEVLLQTVECTFGPLPTTEGVPPSRMSRRSSLAEVIEELSGHPFVGPAGC